MHGGTNAGGEITLFAAIGVTYPEGSTLTCTDGTKTLKAKTTTGLWTFAVPYAGLWTVTATDGTNTKSQTVEITAAGQSVSVTLSYAYVIFDEMNGLREGYIGNTHVTEEMDATGKYLCFAHGGGYNAMAYLKTAIDVTEYDTLEIYGYTTATTRYMALWDVEPTSATVISGKNPVGSITLVKGTAPELYTLDISKLSGSYYLAAQYAAAAIYVYSLLLR